MLDTIKTFFEKNFSVTDLADSQEHSLKLATAALLIEMMRQDEQMHEAEQQAIKKALAEKFDLDKTETQTLYQLAEQEAKQATDYHQFTRLIAAHFTQTQKIKVIEYLWMVAYADKHLDKYEEHMVRRIADLIHVSHKDYMQAKHRVELAEQ